LTDAAHRANSLHAAQVTTLAALAATGAAFGIGFLLPRRPRSPAGNAAEIAQDQRKVEA
jgi:hypothetical protein